MTWEEIHGFQSPSEFERFTAWINSEVAAGRAVEVSVRRQYDIGTIRGGRWFENANTGETWRLVPPDFPFCGLWEPFPLDQIFCTVAAQKLKGSASDDVSLRAALAQYLASGRAMNIGQEALIDYLGISTPSVLSAAGFSEEEQDRAMTLLGELSDDEIREAALSIPNN